MDNVIKAYTHIKNNEYSQAKGIIRNFIGDKLNSIFQKAGYKKIGIKISNTTPNNNSEE